MMSQSLFRFQTIRSVLCVVWGLLLVLVPFLFTDTADAASLLDHVITDTFQSDGTCTKPVEKKSFETTADKVYSWVHLSNASPFDRVTWRWIDPDNSVYATVPWTVGVEGSTCAAAWMAISGQPAADKTGNWKAEIYLDDALTATDTFSIGVPTQPGLPKVSFSPPEAEPLVGGEIFDLVIHIESYTDPLVTSFAMYYNDMDITATFFAWLEAGVVLLSINGNQIDLTFPNISLPAGQHNISVTVGNPNGTTTATWSMNMAAPKYTPSATQDDLLNTYGNPDYLSILFNSDQKRREETWTYSALGKVYLFWDGVKVGEKSVGIDATLYANPPMVDPTLFTDKTTLTDVINLFGGNYTMADGSMLDPDLADLNFITYNFEDKGVYASFVGGQMVYVMTTDIPVTDAQGVAHMLFGDTETIGSTGVVIGPDAANADSSGIQTLVIAIGLGAIAMNSKILEDEDFGNGLSSCIQLADKCLDFFKSLVKYTGADEKGYLVKYATLGFVLLGTSVEIVDEGETACDGDPPTNTADITCPVECTSFGFSAWSECQPDNTQTRTVVSKTPEGCTTEPDPSLLTQSCTYQPPACEFTYTDWSECQSDGYQYREEISRSPEGCTGDPVLAQECNSVQECVAWDYTGWSECQPDGYQYRTVIMRYPEGCVGDGDTVMPCDYHPPCTGYDFSDSGCEPSSLYGPGLGAITRTYSGIPEGCVGGIAIPQTEYICCSLDPC